MLDIYFYANSKTGKKIIQSLFPKIVILIDFRVKKILAQITLGFYNSLRKLIFLLIDN